MVMVTRSKSAGNPDLLFKPKPYVRSTRSLTAPPRQTGSRVPRANSMSTNNPAIPVHPVGVRQQSFLMEHDYAKKPNTEPAISAATGSVMKKFAIFALCLLILTGVTWIVCHAACSCSPNEPEANPLVKVRSQVQEWAEMTLTEGRTTVETTLTEIEKSIGLTLTKVETTVETTLEEVLKFTAWAESGLENVTRTLGTLMTTSWNQTLTSLNKTLNGFPCYCNAAPSDEVEPRQCSNRDSEYPNCSSYD